MNSPMRSKEEIQKDIKRLATGALWLGALLEFFGYGAIADTTPVLSLGEGIKV